MFGGETDHSELAHVQKKKVEMLGFFKEMKWHKKSVYAWQSAMETDLLWNHEVHEACDFNWSLCSTEQKQVSFQINVVEQKKVQYSV